MHIYSLKYTKPSLWQPKKDCDKIYENLHSTAIENIYLGQMHAQSGLGLTFIDWDQAWRTLQHNIYWFDWFVTKQNDWAPSCTP